LSYVLDNTSKVTLRGSDLQRWRVVDADSRLDASFSFLLMADSNMGVVLVKLFSALVEVINE